jgi:7,8-dihydropterin-6-yl-methyl-4-(beta-D-ribofuranosyl)aminobenzene 5'-phosphate synthase
MIYPRKITMKMAYKFLALVALANMVLLPVSAMAAGEIKIITVMDNEAVDSALATEWGFAAAVTTPEGAVLFDTGPNGKALLANMEKLGLTPGQFSKVVISHDHKDHTYGLKAFVTANPQVLVLVPRKSILARRYVADAGGQVQEVSGPSKVAPGIRTTGSMERFSQEQALIIDTAEGLVVITGCAHPGIVAVIAKVEELNPGKPVALVMGGFHLFQTLPQTIDRIVDDLKRLKVARVAPSHCTGDYARRRLQEVYGKDYVAGGAGLTLSFDSPQ